MFTTDVRTTQVELDGHRTVLLHAGPEAAHEAAVFVHGNPGSSEDWRGLLAGAGGLVRAVAWDHPGFGRSSPPPTFEPSVAAYADQMERMLDHLGVARAHLVLHDFGGPWGLHLAARRPERIASVVLIDTGVLLGYRWHALARIWRTPVLGELFQLMSSRLAYRLLLRRGQSTPLPRSFVDRMYDDMDATTKRTVLRLYRSVADVGAASAELAAALRPWDLPAKVIWGADDPYVPARLADAQRDAFPSASVRVLDGVGHWPFVDAPERVADEVLPFLRAQLSTASPRSWSHEG